MLLINAHRMFILLICTGLLAVEPIKVYGLQSSGTVLGWSKEDHGIVSFNRRMLKEASQVKLDASVKTATVTGKMDPNQSNTHFVIGDERFKERTSKEVRLNGLKLTPSVDYRLPGF
ncbi:hypothetical protein POM88_026338 [Heracleum sosnowskyi]|uniref:Uncharacterized protein n=1 Tax=Heracleum sosnowskyi TaxID=360622 RepID=A0AAD8MP42_9APIA|nr:hypothetical protein POM88_026338 [Heracleum sosnowskyi]